MAAYEIEFTSSAEKAFRRLPQAVRRRFSAAFILLGQGLQLLRRLERPVLVDTVNWISSFYFLMMAEYPIEDREASYR